MFDTWRRSPKKAPIVVSQDFETLLSLEKDLIEVIDSSVESGLDKSIYTCLVTSSFRVFKTAVDNAPLIEKDNPELYDNIQHQINGIITVVMLQVKKKDERALRTASRFRTADTRVTPDPGEFIDSDESGYFKPLDRPTKSTAVPNPPAGLTPGMSARESIRKEREEWLKDVKENSGTAKFAEPFKEMDW